VTVDERQRRRYLEAMGITLWEQRWSPQQIFTKDDSKTTKNFVTQQAPTPSLLTEPADSTVPTEEPPNESLALENTTVVEAAPQLGASFDLLTEQAETPSKSEQPADDRAIRISQMDWENLVTEVSGCVACDLHKSRTQTVFGVGNRQAAWLIVGEAPGADEDRLGEPFVGRAGKLLDAMLQALGLDREKVFIANILKCRPPKNRDPSPQEAGCCWPFLQRQITLINPRIILAVGRIAAQNLLQTQVAVGKLRGRVHRLNDTEIPIIVSYHPAYLLRSPREKRKAWDDLQLAQRVASRASETIAG
jgi:DNA polymerase